MNNYPVNTKKNTVYIYSFQVDAIKGNWKHIQLTSDYLVQHQMKEHKRSHIRYMSSEQIHNLILKNK